MDRIGVVSRYLIAVGGLVVYKKLRVLLYFKT